MKGESNAPDHKDDIGLRSWSWGAAASSALDSSAATARRSYRSLTVVKSIDCASTALATNDEVDLSGS